MYQYQVRIRLYGTKTISDYVRAESEAEAMTRANKYCLPIYAKANPVILGVKQFRKLKRVLNQWV